MRNKSPFPNLHTFHSQIVRGDLKAMRKTLDRIDDEQRKRLLDSQYQDRNWFALALEKRAWESAFVLLDYGFDVEKRTDIVSNWLRLLRGIEGDPSKPTPPLSEKQDKWVRLLVDELMERKMHIQRTELEEERNGWQTTHNLVHFHKKNPRLGRYFIDQALKNGYDFNVVDNYGETPLTIAVWRLDLEMVDFLLNLNVDKDPINKAGNSLLNYVFMGHSEDEKRNNLELTIPVLERLAESGVYFSPQQILEKAEEKWAGWEKHHPDDLVLNPIRAYVESKNLNASTPKVHVHRTIARI